MHGQDGDDEHRRMRAAVDAEVASVLEDAEASVAGFDPRAGEMVGELARLHRAGGERLRGVLTWWGHRAGGGADGAPVLRAAAAIELLHLMALVHDDVMDGTPRRRGVPAVHVSFAARTGSAELGGSLAVLTGDLAAVLADRFLDGAGFAPERLAAARARYDVMRVAMAVGQYLDLTAERSPRVAALKGGSYSIEGPLAIGAALAGATGAVMQTLEGFGRPVGTAFQLRDDLHDGDAAAADVDLAALKTQALGALDDGAVPPDVTAALTALAEEVTR